MEYDINELVARSGVPRRTIYFYVQQGILPAAEGAGLAARYSEEHLLRLAAIPLLRRRGLRLDEIRARFEHSTGSELQRLIAEAAAEQQQRETMRLQAHNLLRYHLAPGIELLIDGRATAAMRKKVLQLLEQARIIFAEEMEG